MNQPIPTPTVDLNELFDIAILAYRRGTFADAIELLSQIVDAERQNWLAWFYLGLSYLKANQKDKAYRVMRVISALCPTQQLRDTAASILSQDEDVVSPDFVVQTDWRTATGS